MLNKFLYKSYRFFHVWEINWRRRFTGSGFFVVFILILTSVLGVDTTRNMIYQVFSFVLILSIISIIWGVYYKVNCEVRRCLPKFVTAGENFHYSIEVKNKNDHFEKDLMLFEKLQDPRPSFEDFLNAREPGEEKRNIWDRKTMYFRWLWIIRQNLKAVIHEHKIPDISPGDTVNIKVTAKPVCRGYVFFDSVMIARPDPFRLFKAYRKIKKKQKLLVLPKRYALPHFQIPGSRKYNSGGVAFASAIGNSNEFLSLREYRPGDSIRNIHWKSWAKTGDLIIKEYQDEYFTRHALILDTFHEQPYSRIFEEAVSIASSFACKLETEESILDLMFVGNEAYTVSSGRGLASTDKMLEVLSCVQAAEEKNFSQLLSVVEKYAARLSGSICIFIDWDENRSQLIEILKTQGVPVRAFIVTDTKKECELKLGDNINDVTVIDVHHVQEGLMLI